MSAFLKCELPGLFVTGTDTGVGKTWVSAQIVGALVRRGTRAGVIKPVASGIDPACPLPWDSDAAILLDAAGCATPYPASFVDRVNPIRLTAPLAPPVAARLEGFSLTYPYVCERLQRSLDEWTPGSDLMLVEGVGGLLCPLAERRTVADLAADLDFPLIIVARRGLGTLNHTLLTLEAARMRGLRVAGVILNGAVPTAAPLAEQTNAEELARWLDREPILAEVPCNPSLETVSRVFDAVNWGSLSERSRMTHAGT